jgi:hypothetical protein
MIAWRLFISFNTIIAYWLLTHPEHRRIGLWWTLATELQWMLMFGVSEIYELIPISLFMLGITIKRLLEGDICQLK